MLGRVRFIHPFPKHFQIQSILRDRILRAQDGGTKLPAETALAREFGVSRVTVRQALAALERERLIRREKGRGTFVAQRVTRPTPKPKLTGFMEDLIAAGAPTRVKLLRRVVVPATREVAAQLRVQPGEKVLHVERLRYVEERPLSYLHSYLPLDIAQKLSAEDLEAAPIITLLHQRHRVPIVEAEQVIEAAVADVQAAELLEVPVGAPLLQIERSYMSRKGRPIYYVHSFYRADRYRYTVKLIQPLRRRRAGPLAAPRGG